MSARSSADLVGQARYSDVLAPIIASACNTSFQQVTVPACFKQAIVRPLLKKRTLNVNDPSSYRPISNLSFLSKVVEKVVDARLSRHVERYWLLPNFQSAYRPYHSTETAIVRVLNDMIMAVDKGYIGCLMLLDLSAAFDTVDHDVLMDVLRRRFGVTGRFYRGIVRPLVVKFSVRRSGNFRQLLVASLVVWPTS